MRPALAGDTATPILPNGPSGSPGLFETSSQVSPPSLLRHSPLSGPPLLRFQKLRRTCHIAANIRRGLLGSMLKSPAPAFSLLNRTFSQLFPPSCDLNMPRCSFGPKACPSAATKTMSGLVG